MGENRVKIHNPAGTGWLGTRYEIDGRAVDNVKSVDFRVAVDEVPTFTFETMGMPDIDMRGDIRFKFAPETIQDAAAVIQHEFTAGSPYYEAMVVSIQNLIQKADPDAGEKYSHELAEAIARTVIGIEDQGDLQIPQDVYDYYTENLAKEGVPLNTETVQRIWNELHPDMQV